MSDIDDMIARIAAKAPKLTAQSLERRPLPGLTLAQAQVQVAQFRRDAGLPEMSLDERLRMRGVPDLLIEAICTGKLHQTAATRYAFELVEKGGLLVLASEAGRGKTMAAAWALSECSGLFVRAVQLATIDETGSLDARMRTARLLVVDDLGTEHSPGGYARSRLEDVVDRRLLDGRSTLLTTNLGPKSFRDRYGERLASRIDADKNPMGWRDLDGPDLRQVREGAEHGE